MAGISSTFDSQEPLLSDLLRDIDRGTLQLPDFQRPWVWDDVHIRSLLASVTLGYPVGAVMLLQAGASDVVFRTRTVHGVKDGAAPPDRLILDGQQRLTSLYGALWSHDAVETRDERQRPLQRHYYLHIDSCLDPEVDRIEAIQSIPADKCITEDFGRKIRLDLRTPTAEYANGLVPACILLDHPAFGRWRTGYQKHFAYEPSHMARIEQFEQEVWMRVQQFKLPVILLLKDTPREAVCQVFEKVNTGGVALTVFELMTATFAARDFGLRVDWEGRRDKLWRYEVLKGIDGTEFLQAVTLLDSYVRHLASKGAVGAKRKDMLRLTLEGYQAQAPRVEEGFVRAARLLARACIHDVTNLPYVSQVIALAAVCAHLGSRFEEENVRNKLLRWYWCGVFGEMYGGAGETRLALDIVDLCAWVLDDGEAPRTVRDADFAPLRLLSMQSRSSAAYKGAMALMVQRGSHDFVNGDPIAHTTGFSLPVDIHHIFPSSWCQKQPLPKEQWNSIVNKTPLTSKTNRSLGGDAPSKYLARLAAQGVIDAARVDEILQTHLVDAVLLRSDDFAGFLRDRARRLLDAIAEAMGKPAQGREADDVVAAFGGPLTWGAVEAPSNGPKVVVYHHYEVLQEISTGGMAYVVHARDQRTGREVCVKRVPTAGRDTDALQREIQIYDRLMRQAFPHAVEVLAVERDERSIALVTAWAGGGTLEDHVVAQPRGVLAPGETKTVATALLQAVGALHALDIVHRDIKPSNVLLDGAAWKLADFGIAKNTLHVMTRATMQQVYTPGFAPPEQVEGATAHPSADVYALGKLICYMLTGGTDPDRVSYPGWRTLVRGCTRDGPPECLSLADAGRALAALPA